MAFVTDSNRPPTALATPSNRLPNRCWGCLRGPFPSNASVGRGVGTEAQFPEPLPLWRLCRDPFSATDKGGSGQAWASRWAPLPPPGVATRPAPTASFELQPQLERFCILPSDPTALSTVTSRGLTGARRTACGRALLQAQAWGQGQRVCGEVGGWGGGIARRRFISSQ